MPKEGFSEFIMYNIRYPENMREAGHSGKVMVGFIVNAKGGIDSVFIANKKDSLFNEFEKEAMRVIWLSSFRWKPAMLNGLPIACHMQIPIKFELMDDK